MAQNFAPAGVGNWAPRAATSTSETVQPRNGHGPEAGRAAPAFGHSGVRRCRRSAAPLAPAVAPTWPSYVLESWVVAAPRPQAQAAVVPAWSASSTLAGEPAGSAVVGFLGAIIVADCAADPPRRQGRRDGAHKQSLGRIPLPPGVCSKPHSQNTRRQFTPSGSNRVYFYNLPLHHGKIACRI